MATSFKSLRSNAVLQKKHVDSLVEYILENMANVNLTLTDVETATLTASGAVALNGAVTQKANVISHTSGATRTLTAAQSGSVVVLSKADGIVVTLPAPAVGLYYDFVVATSVTSNSYKVITDAGTTLLTGQVVGVDTDTSNAVAVYSGNGSTHVAITMNGGTTGGLIGTKFRLTCITATLWAVEGVVNGSGVVATPFATS